MENMESDPQNIENFLTFKIDSLYISNEEDCTIEMKIGNDESDEYNDYNLSEHTSVKDLFIDPLGSQLILILLISNDGKQHLLIVQEDRNEKLRILNNYSHLLDLKLSYVVHFSYPDYELVHISYIFSKIVRNLFYMSKRNRLLIERVCEDYKNTKSSIDNDFIRSLERREYEISITSNLNTDMILMLNTSNPRLLRMHCRTNSSIRDIVDTPLFFKQYLKMNFERLVKENSDSNLSYCKNIKEHLFYSKINIKNIIEERPSKNDNCISYVSYLIMLFDLFNVKDFEVMLNKFKKIVDKYKYYYYTDDENIYMEFNDVKFIDGKEYNYLTHINYLCKTSLMKLIFSFIPADYKLSKDAIIKIIMFNNVDMVKYLLNNGNIAMELITGGGIATNSPLMYSKNSNMFKIFVGNGLQIANATYDYLEGGVDFIKYLSEFGARPNVTTILGEANLEVVKYCYENGMLEIGNIDVDNIRYYMLHNKDMQVADFCGEKFRIYPILNKNFILRSRLYSTVRKFIPYDRTTLDRNKNFDFSMNIEHTENFRKSYFHYIIITRDSNNEIVETKFKVNIMKFLISVCRHDMEFEVLKYIVEELKLGSYFTLCLLNNTFWMNPKFVLYALNNPELRNVMDTSIKGGPYYFSIKWLHRQEGGSTKHEASLAIQALMKNYHFYFEYDI